MFVGHGLTILEKGIEDLKGLDLKGKVAVSLAGAPVSLPGPLGAYAQSIAERWKALKKAGALGVVRILNPDNMDIPWPRLANSRTEPDFTLADPSLNETAGLQLAVVVNPAKRKSGLQTRGTPSPRSLRLPGRTSRSRSSRWPASFESRRDSLPRL